MRFPTRLPLPVRVGWTLALLALASDSLAAGRSPATRPNVVVIHSDDQGWADLGAQGVDPDVRTPHLDQLARDGVRFTRGYASAPSCVPSRAGLITGRYPQRFGIEVNANGPLPLAEPTLAERLKRGGYVSGQVGKWQLEPTSERAARAAGAHFDSFLPPGRGFDEYATGLKKRFMATHDLSGQPLADAPQKLTDPRFRCIWQTDAALSFVERHARDPFFLYLAYAAPHAPLESPEPWFSQTPAALPLERRQALAMLAAMDDGIGRLRARLRELGLERNTLIFFLSDNGAPVKKRRWNGSLNQPLVGEKGMLTDGGIRVPFLAAWPGTLPASTVYERPVINLDVAATAVAMAGLPRDPQLDGVNLLPFLRGDAKGDPHAALFWRWRSQAAVLADRWKFVLLGEERLLFDLGSPDGETRNQVQAFPKVAADLEAKLMAWSATLPPPVLPRKVHAKDRALFDAHAVRGDSKP